MIEIPILMSLIIPIRMYIIFHHLKPARALSISAIFSSNTAAAITGRATRGLAGHVPGTHPVVHRNGQRVTVRPRLRSTPRWRATRQVYRRGSYLTKTKWDKISGDFQDFVRCISAGHSFRTNIILLLSASFCQAIFMLLHRDSRTCR